MRTFGLRCGSGARLVKPSPITLTVCRAYEPVLGIVRRLLTCRIEPEYQRPAGTAAVDFDKAQDLQRPVSPGFIDDIVRELTEGE